MDAERLGIAKNIDALAAQSLTDRLRHIGIFTPHDLPPGLDDRHMTAEAAKSLRHFNAGIAAAKHDQMRRHVIEFQRLDVGQRTGLPQARNVWNSRVRADVDDDLVAAEQTRAPLIEGDLDRLRAHEMTVPMISSAPLS